MVPFSHLSLTCRSIPHRRAHEKGRNSHPGTFHRPSANMLFRLTIYVKNIENLTYIASTKKPGHPDFKKNKQTTGDIVSRGQKYFAHTQIQTKQNNEKLVFICPPSLYPQPSGPKLWTFPAGCLEDG